MASDDWVSRAKKYAGKIDVGSGPVPLQRNTNNGGKPVARGKSVPGKDLRPERKKG